MSVDPEDQFIDKIKSTLAASGFPDKKVSLPLDKVKSGSFNMVDIYLEGLTPRMKTQWEKLGKKPKKRQVKLVTEEELKEELEKAKEARKKYEEQVKKEKGG